MILSNENNDIKLNVLSCSIFCLFPDYEQYNKYSVVGALPKLEKLDTFFSSTREKRDVNDKPVSINSNSTSTLARIPLTSTSSTVNSVTNSTIPTVNLNNTRLLGVNGTGQRKDVVNTVKPTIVSEPISTDASKTTASNNNNNNNSNNINKNLGSLNKNEYTTQSSTSIDDDLDSKILESVDMPSENFNRTLTEHFKNETFRYEHFQYYNSTTIVNEQKSLEYWGNMKNFTISPLLSKSHRRAIVSNIFTFLLCVQIVVEIILFYFFI